LTFTAPPTAAVALVIPTLLPSATPSPLPTATPEPSATPRPTATALPSLAEVIAEVNPSIVTVINARSVPGVNNSTSEELVWGSGVIIDSRGYVLTNEHVAGAAQDLIVTMANGRNAPARYIAGDGIIDLALIKVEWDWRFEKLPWGDSTRLRVGDEVAVIGSPLGNLRNTVTTGIVSGLDRRIYLEDDATVSGLIQTDAAINRGNSGGALVDERGRLVGIVTLIIRQTVLEDDPLVQGIGFAIPAADARAYAEEWLAEDAGLDPGR
jgi:S1-C subfamily serine protease